MAVTFTMQERELIRTLNQNESHRVPAAKKEAEKVVKSTTQTMFLEELTSSFNPHSDPRGRNNLYLFHSVRIY
jgi:hypothetical protein